MSRFVRLSTFLGWAFACLICGAGVVVTSFYLYLTPNLPEAKQLKNTQLQTPLRIYSSDNKRIAEFGEKRRTPIRIEDAPQNLVNAFIAAEDNRFYEHRGIDIKGLLRAASQLIASGRIKTGGSTITMQVAKNFFLSRERTFTRKFNEIFLAIQIEQSLSKNEILELYLNKIYLGNRAYGVHAAAQVYYGKNIADLSLAEAAMIAGLPKAPSAYNPLANPERALIRRNWILDRMLDLGMISVAQHQSANAQPVTAEYHVGRADLEAPYAAEMARLEIIKRFGAKAYTEGYTAYLTLDSRMQEAANRAVKKGLDDYDRRHGYRGPIASLNAEQMAQEPSKLLSHLNGFKHANHHTPAIVTSLSEDQAKLIDRSGQEITLGMEGLDWAAPYISVDRQGKAPETPEDVLKVGDIVLLIQTANGWELTQTPQAQGALISIAPRNGAIQAINGGYDFGLSHYNRATQAKRQPGSAFKAFIYLAALEQGATAATLINDAPIVFDDKNLETAWRPENSSGKFYGPTRLRKALYNSRNLVSIRLLKETGIRPTIATLKRFGFEPRDLPRDLSLALGSAGITPMDIAKGYAMIANGGHYVEPYLVERIEDADGNIIYQAEPLTVCQKRECESLADEDASLPLAPRIADERIIYILHSMLKDVILKGTGRRALSLKRDDLGGKTGTTNDQKDAWFSGFNTHIATTAWVGFDTPKTLGRREYGARAALPIWTDFMHSALAGTPSAHMQRPDGLVTVRIDPKTGLAALPEDGDAIFEVFRKEYAPRPPAGSSTRMPGNGSRTGNTQPLAPEDIF